MDFAVLGLLKRYTQNSLFLTSLVGGKRDGGGLLRFRVVFGHPIHGPDVEGVVSVSLQLVDRDPSAIQAESLRRVAYTVATWHAPCRRPCASLTHHAVGEVAAATGGQRRSPFQQHRRLIHAGDQMLWSRGGT